MLVCGFPLTSSWCTGLNGKSIVFKRRGLNITFVSPNSSAIKIYNKSIKVRQVCFRPCVKVRLVCCLLPHRRWRFVWVSKKNVLFSKFMLAGLSKVLWGLTQYNKNADGAIKLLKLFPYIQMLSDLARWCQES